jgi:hypothetical protein
MSQNNAMSAAFKGFCGTRESEINSAYCEQGKGFWIGIGLISLEERLLILYTMWCEKY